VADTDLPDCPIRPDCRWFLQRGGRSCAVCEVLVTDVELTDHDLPREVAARRARYAPATDRRLARRPRPLK
jgi:hypothetical protein